MTLLKVLHIDHQEGKEAEEYVSPSINPKGDYEVKLKGNVEDETISLKDEDDGPKLFGTRSLKHRYSSETDRGSTSYEGDKEKSVLGNEKVEEALENTVNARRRVSRVFQRSLSFVKSAPPKKQNGV